MVPLLLKLTWRVALKANKVKQEFLADIDILLMDVKGIQGGITQVATRSRKVNNK